MSHKTEHSVSDQCMRLCLFFLHDVVEGLAGCEHRANSEEMANCNQTNADVERGHRHHFRKLEQVRSNTVSNDEKLEDCEELCPKICWALIDEETVPAELRRVKRAHE